MEKRINVRWDGELDFEAANEDGVTMRMGAASSAVPAFRPAALVLVALAGCTGMDAISIMRKKRIEVGSYAIEVVGQQREEHPRLFTSIVVTHVVKGSAIEDKAVARSIELSSRKYCAVGATLASGDTTINHRMRISDDHGERTCDCLTIGPQGAGLSRYEKP